MQVQTPYLPVRPICTLSRYLACLTCDKDPTDTPYRASPPPRSYRPWPYKEGRPTGSSFSPCTVAWACIGSVQSGYRVNGPAGSCQGLESGYVCFGATQWQRLHNPVKTVFQIYPVPALGRGYCPSGLNVFHESDDNTDFDPISRSCALL